MDRFDTMLAFTRVVELASFTKAALSLNLPKTTVSAQVFALEKRLSVKLLHRTTRQVSVTTDGAAYYERAIRLLNELDETESSLTQAVSKPKGRLRIDVPAPIGRHIIIPALNEFFARYPDIDLEVGCNDRPVDLIEEGVDCVIRIGNPMDESLVARRVGAIRFIYIASPEYLNKYGRPKTPEEMERHNGVYFFSTKTGKIFDFAVSIDDINTTVLTQKRVAFNDGDAIVEACLAGLGIGRVPTFMVQDYIAKGSLEVVLGEYLSESMPMNALYLQNRHLSSKVRAFIDWIAELFDKSDLIQVKSALPGLKSS